MAAGVEIEIERIAARAQRESRLPSLVVATAREQARIGSAVIGKANWTEGASVEAEIGTPYRIGSITKTFTAAVVLRLAERGELDLDAPVRSYLPETSFGQVRLRSLLAHCGGLQREVPVDMWASMHGPD